MAKQKVAKQADIDALARDILVAGGLAALPTFAHLRARQFYEVAAAARRIAEQHFDLAGKKVHWCDPPSGPTSGPKIVVLQCGWYTETGQHPTAIFVTKQGGYRSWSVGGGVGSGSSLPPEAMRWKPVTWHDIRVGTEWLGFSEISRQEMERVTRDDKKRIDAIGWF